MGRTDEVEVALRAALAAVIQHGVILISGESGVIWNEEQGLWVWDHELFVGSTPHCCCLGAYLITQQPDIVDSLSASIAYLTASKALQVDKVWIRDLANGFDLVPYQENGYPDAHALGVQLNRDYKPLSFETLAFGGADEVRITNSYREYLQEFCLSDQSNSLVSKRAG